jgi:hypothetical protein
MLLAITEGLFKKLLGLPGAEIHERLRSRIETTAIDWLSFLNI